MTTLSRNEEIQQIHKDYTAFYQLGGGLFLVLIGVLIGALIFSDDSGYGTNIYTEILSVGLTILVLNGLQERRDNRNRIKDLQEQLVREAGSSVNATARTAIDTMRKRGWLGRDFYPILENNRIVDTQALLKGADLSNADLQGADLTNVDLSNANLEYANLSGADLRDTNLSDANLCFADLSDASLERANLSNADILGADFSSAQLGDVNLNNVKLGRYRGIFRHVLQRALINLSNTNLSNIDLDGFKLERVNLNNTNLEGVNLSERSLMYTTLDKANLFYSDLSKVDFLFASLRGANLQKSDLSNAQLIHADLTGANLYNANLSNVFIRDTKFDENTTLPDGAKWSEKSNLARFGVETREIKSEEGNFFQVRTYQFIDGTKRRYQYLKGWLDDREGNPIDED